MDTEKKWEIHWMELLGVSLVLLAMGWFLMRPHRVGTIDMGRVARDVGVLERISADDRAYQEKAYSRILRLQQTHAQKTNELARALRSAKTDDEKAKAREDLAAADDAFQMNVNSIRQDVQRHKALVVNTFRKRLQPFVEKAARRQRMDAVLEVNAGIVYARGAADITEAVTAGCRSFFATNTSLIDAAVELPSDQADTPLAAPRAPAGRSEKGSPPRGAAGEGAKR